MSEHDEVMSVLIEIRDLLRLSLIGPELTESTECGHPEEARTSLSGMGAPEWICRACGYHCRPENHAAG